MEEKMDKEILTVISNHRKIENAKKNFSEIIQSQKNHFSDFLKAIFEMFSIKSNFELDSNVKFESTSKLESFLNILLSMSPFVELNDPLETASACQFLIDNFKWSGNLREKLNKFMDSWEFWTIVESACKSKKKEKPSGIPESHFWWKEKASSRLLLIPSLVKDIDALLHINLEEPICPKSTYQVKRAMNAFNKQFDAESTDEVDAFNDNSKDRVICRLLSKILEILYTIHVEHLTDSYLWTENVREKLNIVKLYPYISRVLKLYNLTNGMTMTRNEAYRFRSLLPLLFKQQNEIFNFDQQFSNMFGLSNFDYKMYEKNRETLV